MGCVAIVTGRHGMMTGLLPAVILVAHDVTVDTRFGVVGKVGSALGIIEGKAGQPKEDAQPQTERQW